MTGFARERFTQTTINGSNANGAVVSGLNIVHCGTGGRSVSRQYPAAS